MVQMKLFEGKEQSHRCREWIFGHRRGGGGWDVLEIRIDTYIHYHG